MKKKIIILHSGKNLVFSIGEREVKLSESMPLKDAEAVAAQYPGLYLKIVEEAATETKAPKATNP